MALEILQKETYLAMIKNSAGSHLFRNLFALVAGERRDILEGGSLSCAFFVSSILYHFDLVQGLHATVAGLIRDLEASGWQKVEEPQDGAVLVWEEQPQVSGVHGHVGFSLGGGRAVSHLDSLRAPGEHSDNFDGTRKVVATYAYPSLA